MGYQLMIIQGRGASQIVKLAENVTTTVGRQDDCLLQVRSSQVSRKHCELFQKKGLLLVKDLGSTNGTFVNGKKLTDQRVLEPGDELAVGGVKFRVARAEAPAPGAHPTDTAVPEPVSVSEVELVEDQPIALDDQATFLLAPDDDQEAAPKETGEPSPEPEPSAEAEPEGQPELGEDAVADFLMNIDLDDEDKV